MAVLKRMYNLAYRSKPRKVRDIPAFPHFKESAPRDGFVQDKEYITLQDHAEELWLKAILAVGYTFGFRRSELLRLKVRQIDWTRRMIRLEAGSTKNDDARTVKMTTEVTELVSLCVRNKKPEDNVFTRGENDPVMDFRGAWYRLCEIASLGSFVKGPDGKLKWKGLIFHDLRRSAVRNMVRRGVPEKVAMLISGHKSRSVFDRYNIVNESDIEEASAKIEAGERRSGINESAESTARPTGTKTSTSNNGGKEQAVV